MAADTQTRPVTTPRSTGTPMSILRGVVHDRRRSLMLWSIALAAVSAIYTAFYPAIGEEQMVDMAEMMPEDLAAALGYDRLGDAAGYLTATVFGLLGPALLLVFAIGTGGRLVAGSEEDGTLELELAHPVSRRSIYAERWLGLAASVTTLVAVLAAVTLALVVGLDLDVGVGGLLTCSLGLLLFALAHATVAFAVGAATGRRAIGVGVAAGLAAAGYIGDAVGPLVEGAGWLQTVSPWYWYLGGDPLVDGIDLGGFAALLALTSVAAVVGLLRFDRRDLGV